MKLGLGIEFGNVSLQICLLLFLQVHLRRSSRETADPENDLYQWYRGSKFCCGPLEGIITLDPTATGYEIKVRGPGSMKADW